MNGRPENYHLHSEVEKLSFIVLVKKKKSLPCIGISELRGGKKKQKRAEQKAVELLLYFFFFFSA